MPRSEAQRLQDMRDACERIARFLVGFDLEAFRADQRTVRASDGLRTREAAGRRAAQASRCRSRAARTRAASR